MQAFLDASIPVNNSAFKLHENHGIPLPCILGRRGDTETRIPYTGETTWVNY